MADYGSSLPVETLSPGDVDVTIYDSTGANAWSIDSSGRGLTSIEDSSGNALVIGASGEITVDQAAGSEIQVTDGTDTLQISASGEITVLQAAGNEIQITDGVETWLIDSNGAGLVSIQDSSGDQLDINTDGSINVNVVNAVVTGEIHEFGTSAAVASGSSSSVVDYIVSAGKTLLLSSFQASSSGKAKVELKAGTDGSETVRAVAFISTANGMVEMTLPNPIEVAAADSVLVVVTNNEPGQAVDLYGYINGREV